MPSSTSRFYRLLALLPTVVFVLACPPRPQPAPADAAFGIAECDSYFQKAFACVEKRPTEVRSRVAVELEQTRRAWLPAATQDGGGRDDLRAACRSALDALDRSAECR